MNDHTSPDGSTNRVPDATVARLPVYLRALTALADSGTQRCDSTQLAAEAGVNPAMLRKDLSHLGSYGTRGVGYDVGYLQYHIARAIGQTQDWNIAIIGIGNLGSALSHYAGFSSRGMKIKALFDADPTRVGTKVAGHLVHSVDDLEKIIRKNAIVIAVIATPADQAQQIADRLISAGVTSILDFAPVHIRVPDHVQVRRVDLATELQILAYHEQKRSELSA